MTTKRAPRYAWTDVEDQVLRLCTEDRYSAKAIALCLSGRTEVAIFSRRHHLGLPHVRDARSSMPRGVISHYRGLAQNAAPRGRRLAV